MDPQRIEWDRRKANRRPGYRIYDPDRRSWLEKRVFLEGLGWVDYWTWRADHAQRFAGAKAARRMLAKLDNRGLVICNKRGAVM